MCVGSPLGECVHAVRDEDVRLALAVAADEPVQAGRHDLLTPEITIMPPPLQPDNNIALHHILLNSFH